MHLFDELACGEKEVYAVLSDLRRITSIMTWKLTLTVLEAVDRGEVEERRRGLVGTDGHKKPRV